jgi:hypothetical protein
VHWLESVVSKSKVFCEEERACVVSEKPSIHVPFYLFWFTPFTGHVGAPYLS